MRWLATVSVDEGRPGRGRGVLSSGLRRSGVKFSEPETMCVHFKGDTTLQGHS